MYYYYYIYSINLSTALLNSRWMKVAESATYSSRLLVLKVLAWAAYTTIYMLLALLAS